jgi:hypothetical protein
MENASPLWSFSQDSELDLVPNFGLQQNGSYELWRVNIILYFQKFFWNEHS